MNGLKELAEQAGMHYRQFEDEFCKADTDGVPAEMLEAFAKLVAAKEREACAKMVEDSWMAFARRSSRLDITPFPELTYVAKAIRARK